MSGTDDTVAFHAEQRERLRRALAPNARTGTPEEAVIQGMAARERPITVPKDADYALPSHFTKTVDAKHLARLRDLLGHLRALREQMVGLPGTAAEALYNGDAYALLIREGFQEWLSTHAATRANKRPSRDDGRPVDKFVRLHGEFGEWLDDFVHREGTGHAVALVGLDHWLGWLLASKTWFVYVERDEDGVPRRILAPSREDAEFCQRMWQTGSWGDERRIADVITRTPGLTVRGEPALLAAELRGMGSDLTEVKALLARTYRPEDHIVEVGPGIWATWIWETAHVAGVIVIQPSEAGVRDHVVNRPGDPAVEIALDGMPRHPSMPWLPVGPEVVPWAVGLLRPLHRHMLWLWDAADRPAEATVEAVTGSDQSDGGEAVAAACERVALADVGRDPRVRVPQVRRVTLFALLERHFQCEIQSSKGSEVTVYRKGGRKFTLPGHERNTHFHARTVTAMLKAIGVDVGEFCRIAG